MMQIQSECNDMKNCRGDKAFFCRIHHCANIMVDALSLIPPTPHMKQCTVLLRNNT